MPPERTTDKNVSGHRRLVTRAIVTALRDVFDASYDRDPQLVNLKVTNTFPLAEVDYPCIVVEYEPSRVLNAGVGHEEWFNDANNVLRKWYHSRFEGSVGFDICGMSPIDRDLVADALEEVLRFGRLDSQLNRFFIDLYGDPASTTVELLFTQVVLNTDEISAGGNSQGVAPWSPEDTMVYQTNQTVEIHGGFYNVVPTQTWGYVSRAKASPFDETVDLTIPLTDPATLWTNPFVYEDSDTVTGVASISGVDALA